MGMPFFVGHAFTDQKIDDLRETIDGAATADPKFEFTPVYADQIVAPTHILEKIKLLIAQSFFCIFDITENDRPNIFFELGFAHGIRKPHFLICQRDAKIPSDLAGYEFLSYRSFADLRKQLTVRLPQYANYVFQTRPKTVVGHKDLLLLLLSTLSVKRATEDELYQLVAPAGFKRDELRHSLGQLRGPKIIGDEDGQVYLTADGKEFRALVERMYAQSETKETAEKPPTR